MTEVFRPHSSILRQNSEVQSYHSLVWSTAWNWCWVKPWYVQTPTLIRAEHTSDPGSFFPLQTTLHHGMPTACLPQECSKMQWWCVKRWSAEMAHNSNLQFSLSLQLSSYHWFSLWTNGTTALIVLNPLHTYNLNPFGNWSTSNNYKPWPLSNHECNIIQLPNQVSMTMARNRLVLALIRVIPPPGACRIHLL